MLRAIWTVVAIFIAVFMYKAYTSPSRPSRPSTYDVLAMGKEAVRAEVKDPDAVKFGRIWVGKAGNGQVACGYFNGKNSFGAYVGFQRFIAAPHIVVSEEDGSGLIDKMWDESCAPYRQ